MSKIIILITPAEGHFNPIKPIITKLIENGHDIVCITGKVFKASVLNTGAEFVSIPAKWDAGEKETYDFFPELKKKKGLAQLQYYLKHIMLDSVPDAVKMLKDVLKKFPADLVISDSFMIAGSWITQLGGPPNVRISVLPFTLPGKNIPPTGLGLLPGNSLLTKLRNKIINAIFNRILYKDMYNYINKIRKEVGLSPYNKDFRIRGFESSDLFLQMSTPAFEFPRNNLPKNLRFIGPVIISPKSNYKKPHWWSEIKKGLPVILINQGTVAKNYTDLIIPSIEALKDEKMIILAVPVKNGEIKDLPENVYTEKYIPFGNILPHVDLMISNGGFGGTQNALAHGIPIVIAGATEDKMEVAARLEYSGAGINLRKQKPSPKKIKKAVKEILSNPVYKQRAKELQSDYANYDAPVLAAELIEGILPK